MSNFDCGNKIMTKDLQGTVKIKQFQIVPFALKISDQLEKITNAT